jgi:hypothetical protein
LLLDEPEIVSSILPGRHCVLNTLGTGRRYNGSGFFFF